MTVLEILQHIAELKQRLARVTDPVEREDLLDDLVYFQQLLREEQKKTAPKRESISTYPQNTIGSPNAKGNMWGKACRRGWSPGADLEGIHERKRGRRVNGMDRGSPITSKSQKDACGSRFFGYVARALYGTHHMFLALGIRQRTPR